MENYHQWKEEHYYYYYYYYFLEGKISLARKTLHYFPWKVDVRRHIHETMEGENNRCFNGETLISVV